MGHPVYSENPARNKLSLLLRVGPTSLLFLFFLHPFFRLLFPYVSPAWEEFRSVRGLLVIFFCSVFFSLFLCCSSRRRSWMTLVAKVLTSFHASFDGSITSTSVSGLMLYSSVASNSQRYPLNLEQAKNTCSAFSSNPVQVGHSWESSYLCL